MMKNVRTRAINTKQYSGLESHPPPLWIYRYIMSITAEIVMWITTKPMIDDIHITYIVAMNYATKITSRSNMILRFFGGFSYPLPHSHKKSPLRYAHICKY